MPTVTQRVGRLRLRRAFGLVLALFLALPVAQVARPAQAEPTESPTVGTGLAFTIGDPRIAESSGLALDTDNNAFWTSNDSGDSGVAYAIGPDGRTRGTITFDADPIDVEAIAYADGRLFLADIGDNQAQRDSIAIYVISRPVPGQDRGSDFTTYVLTYPDGPHDAEAILVDDRGQIRIVTKAGQGAVYRAPRQLRRGAANQLTKVADAPAWITDATVLPSGDYALRTYLSVEILEPELYAPVARSVLPFQPQGESLTMSMTDNALVVGSEGAQSRVLRVPIPTTLQSGATAGPTPPPSPAPTAEASVTQEPPGVGVNRSGTYLALGLALLVAIAAGLVVFLRDRGSEAPEGTAARRQWQEPEAGEAGEDGEATVVRQPEPPAHVPFPDSPQQPTETWPWGPRP